MKSGVNAAAVLGLGIIFTQTIHADQYSGSQSRNDAGQPYSIKSEVTYIDPAQPRATTTRRAVTTGQTFQSATQTPTSISSTTSRPTSISTALIPQAAEVNEGQAVSDFPRDSYVATPELQSQLEQDRILSQRVRQAINSNSSLSLAAKNIGIQTVNGYVTLTGIVNNTLEKDIIEAKARQTVGVTIVDNRLDTVYP
jgi:osmotically-inducible protein OsmY